MTDPRKLAMQAGRRFAFAREVLAERLAFLKGASLGVSDLPDTEAERERLIAQLNDADDYLFGASPGPEVEIQGP
jgi:hypothetical protein